MSSLRAPLRRAHQLEVEDERLRPFAFLGQHADDRAAAKFAQLDHVVHALTSAGRTAPFDRPDQSSA